MLLQIKPLLKKDKRAISAMIGYVLLITFAIVIGGFLYNWMETYVPKDKIECPDGVSIFIEDVSCRKMGDNNYSLNISLNNNGRFDLGAYTIYGSNDSSQKLATIDLSNYTEYGENKGGVVLFNGKIGNFFKSSDKNKVDAFYNVPYDVRFIEIIPQRLEEIENRKKFVVCSSAKVKKLVYCS